MTFSWTEDIGVGASIDSDDIQELRDNVDWLEDNKCTTYHVDYRSIFDTNEDGADYSGVNAADYDSVNTTNDGYELATYNQTHKEAEDTGDNAANEGYVASTYCSAFYPTAAAYV